jgi:hypothetical protein
MGRGWNRRTAIVLNILVSLDMCTPDCISGNDRHFLNTAHLYIEYTALPWSLPSASYIRSRYCHNRGNKKSCMYILYLRQMKSNEQCVLPSPLLLITSKTTLKPRPFYLSITTTTFTDFPPHQQSMIFGTVYFYSSYILFSAQFTISALIWESDLMFISNSIFI